VICILKMNDDTRHHAIEGWIIATDTEDARRQADAAGERNLAELLYRGWPMPVGKHVLPTGHIALVS
jgi:hypothetical protein